MKTNSEFGYSNKEAALIIFNGSAVCGILTVLAYVLNAPFERSNYILILLASSIASIPFLMVALYYHKAHWKAHAVMVLIVGVMQTIIHQHKYAGNVLPFVGYCLLNYAVTFGVIMIEFVRTEIAEGVKKVYKRIIEKQETPPVPEERNRAKISSLEEESRSQEDELLISAAIGKVKKQERDTFKTVSMLNNEWMAENFSKIATESYYYEDKRNEDGRLYTWKAAVDNCPSGWRLPTYDDFLKITEFLKVENIGKYGPGCGNAEMFNASALIKGGSLGFNASLSGYRMLDGSYKMRGTNTAFWSGTEYGEKNVYCFGMGYNSQGNPIFELTSVPKGIAMSVRYIKEI